MAVAAGRASLGLARTCGRLSRSTRLVGGMALARSGHTATAGQSEEQREVAPWHGLESKVQVKDVSPPGEAGTSTPSSGTRRCRRGGARCLAATHRTVREGVLLDGTPLVVGSWHVGVMRLSVDYPRLHHDVLAIEFDRVQFVAPR